MKRVKEQSRPLHQLLIVGGEGNQSIEQRFEQRGVIRQDPFLNINVSDQLAYSVQGRVGQGKIPHQHLKSDQIALMGEFADCHIKGQFTLIEVHGFPCMEKAKLCLGIDEALNEPGGAKPVDVWPGAGDPGTSLVLVRIEPNPRHGSLLRLAQPFRNAVEHIERPCRGS